MQDHDQRVFIDELNTLRRRAGKPSLERLVMLSRHRDGRVQLARSTISDVLNYKRVGWPEWAWVKELVLACRAAADEDGIALGEMGEVSYWYARYTGPEEACCEVDQEKMRRYVAWYGRTGGRLLRRASDGDPDAAFHLGVLLHCDRSYDEAREWLYRAARGEHLMARALYHHPRPLDVVDGAPRVAYDIGRSAVPGNPSVAKVFFTRAALAGHADAAERLAALYDERGTERDARLAAGWRDWARTCRTTAVDDIPAANWMRSPQSPEESMW